jgi:hypothetical protein
MTDGIRCRVHFGPPRATCGACGHYGPDVTGYRVPLCKNAVACRERARSACIRSIHDQSNPIRDNPPLPGVDP